MDRREALLKLPELSAGCLDAATEAAVRRWVDECPRCKAEWASLQAFLGALETVPSTEPTEEQSRQMWSCCSEALFDKIEAERVRQARPSLWSWMSAQPRWGWAMLGGAVAILGAAVLLPDAPAANAPITVASAPANSAQPGELESFRRPPSYAASLVDHHAQMGADPFSDRVGSSLVSYSASFPVTREGGSR